MVGKRKVTLPNKSHKDGPFQSSDFRPVILANFGPPSLAFIRSWGTRGAKVGMVCICDPYEPIPGSKFLQDWVSVNRKHLYTEEGLRIIGEFLNSFKATGIICIEEKISCWLKDASDGLPRDFAVWVQKSEKTREVLSKINQIKVAEKVGLKVLPTYVLEKPEQANLVRPEHMPLCLRPAGGGLVTPSFKVKLINSREELADCLSQVGLSNETIVAQPFRSLPNLVVHGARTESGETLDLKGFIVDRKFEGVSLCILPINLDRDLQGKYIAFTDELEIVGGYHFDFLFNPKSGAAKFLEINSRLGGTTARVYALGYDEPFWALKAYGVNGRVQGKLRSVKISNRMALLKYLYYALTNRLTPLDYPEEARSIRILNAILGFCFWRDDVFALNDIQGSMALYLGNIKSRLNLG